jgi:hypothetical protein
VVLLDCIRWTRDLECYVNTFGNVSFRIFQLSFGQGRLGRWRPVHWLSPAEDEAFLEHFSKNTNLGGFEFRLEGQIGMIKISINSISLKARRLLFDSLLGKSGSLFTECDRRERLPFLGLHGLKYLQFDGETVTIPTRYKMHLFSVESLLSIDEIF